MSNFTPLTTLAIRPDSIIRYSFGLYSSTLLWEWHMVVLPPSSRYSFMKNKTFSSCPNFLFMNVNSERLTELDCKVNFRSLGIHMLRSWKSNLWRLRTVLKQTKRVRHVHKRSNYQFSPRTTNILLWNMNKILFWPDSDTKFMLLFTMHTSTISFWILNYSGHYKFLLIACKHCYSIFFTLLKNQIARIINLEIG